MRYTDSQTSRIGHFVSHFERLHQASMQDSPVVNRHLSVAAIGFRSWSTDDWEDALFGVLLTPWIFSLVILPESVVTQSRHPLGTKYEAALPVGNIEFYWSVQESVGIFLSCSLMSPVLSFQTQHQAEALANDTLNLLLTLPSDHRINQKSSTTRSGLVKRITQNYRKHMEAAYQ